jgi:hypothetical protein
MPTNTYVALNTVTVGTATNSITFTSIPSTYTDLVIIGSIAGFSTGGNIFAVQCNGDTASNYSGTGLIGTGSAAQSNRYSNLLGAPIGGHNNGTGTGQAVVNISVQNYSNSTTYKTVLSRFSSSTQQVEADVALWRSTAAITSLTVYVYGGATTISAGSTFTIYGISSAGDATPKATGGDVTSDATYWYHTFAMSGNFVPNQTLSCDYLIVAGGGGAGNNGSGGGGAGGYRTATASSFTAGTYQVLVGAGGAGRVASGQGNGASGSLSAIGSIQSAGGGFSSFPSGTSGSGGSGGGSGSTSAGGAGNTPSTSPSQGNNGGNQGVSQGGAGGGGGAGAVGGNGSSTTSGVGGIGSFTAISGGATTGYGQLVSGNYYFAGGGGGGGNNDSGVKPGAVGGSGGGGAGGASNVAGANALVNTGGGGGGAGNVNPNWVAGGNGGSGIVIIRYAK